MTEFESHGVGAFGYPGRYDTTLQAHLQWDYADTDILGRERKPDVPQELRGLMTFRHRQELTENWSVQTQIHDQSDRNFYEQWWKHEYDEDLNQETYLQLKYQYENFALTGLLKPGIRNWANEGEALPRADAWFCRTGPLPHTQLLWPRQCGVLPVQHDERFRARLLCDAVP